MSTENKDNRAAILQLLKETTRRIELTNKKDHSLVLLHALVGSYITKRERLMVDYLLPFINSEYNRSKFINEQNNSDDGDDGDDYK